MTAKEKRQLNVMFAALEKISKKELDRPKLKPAKHLVDLKITGSIDGEKVSVSIGSMVNVKPDVTKSSSSSPKMAKVVGYLVSLLSKPKQEQVISDLPADYLENGWEFPEVAETLQESVDAMLKRLRKTSTTTAAGAITCEYKVN